jgi:hypothetical protein
MTTVEPCAPLRADEPAWVASPPQTCLNGCHSGHGDARRPVETEGRALICSGKDSCTKRLGDWLRSIPELVALLPYVVAHGTVASNPENVRAKNPDPPAPLRLEIRDLLDYRRGIQYDDHGQPIIGDNRHGVFGIILGWAGRIRIERHEPRSCDCGHPASLHRWAPPLASLCRANCGCRDWRITTTLTRECSYLLGNLAWCTEQPWVEDLYAEIKPLHRQLRDAVGEYRTHPVGTCKAQPLGQDETAVCGGPLFMKDDGRAVECADCGNRQEADSGLRELGLKVGLIGDDGTTTGSRKAAS